MFMELGRVQRVCCEVARIQTVFQMVVGVDVVGPRRRQNLCVKTGWRDVKSNGRGRIINARPAVGFDSRILRGQFRSDDRRFDDIEESQTSVRCGKRNLNRIGRSGSEFQRSLRNDRPEITDIDRECFEFISSQIRFGAATRSGNLVNTLPQIVERRVGQQSADLKDLKLSQFSTF